MAFCKFVGKIFKSRVKVENRLVYMQSQISVHAKSTAYTRVDVTILEDMTKVSYLYLLKVKTTDS